MKKTYIALGFLFTTNATFTHTPHANAEQETPFYAKWGNIAVKEALVKYPNANIIDYLHQGSEEQQNKTIEKFKLWLKEGDREFGVFIRITFNTKTEEVITIEFQETSQ